MLVFDSALHYCESATNLNDQLVKIDQIINGLLDLQITVIDKGDIEEYFLDDGQTKIRNRYRSSAQISEAIDAWNKRKQILINQLNGRNMRLRTVSWLGRRN